MVHGIIFLAVVAIVVYFIVKHSSKAAADVAVVDADVKADVAKVEADIKKVV